MALGDRNGDQQAPDVTTYIDEIPDERRRAAIQQLRALCRKNLTGDQECMEYGMPGYKHKGTLEVSFANQKGYIALYILKKAVIDEFRTGLGTSDIGKSCIRFKNPDKINFEIVGKMLRKNAASPEEPC